MSFVGLGFDSARSGHAPDAGGGGALTGSFPPHRVEIDDTPVLLGSARIVLRSAVPPGAGVDGQPSCLSLKF
ncbi:hypothetical protein [Nocardia amikacinitolerans]|uniref:hypothetical protein n=1 Tax=Nocardia amikacinitolerans TaxID=756689 RepID=UPI0020A28518|nr:hypothetical protein [Nocardia amikacinitolerans]